MKLWQLIIIFLLIIGAISLISSIEIPEIDEPIIDDNPGTSTDDDIDVEKIVIDETVIIF